MNFAWAKKNKGQFIIRIEDTDQTRIVAGGEQTMLNTFNALGLVADESPLVGGPYAPYRQSERLSIYKQYAEELIQKGKAYYCICTPERLDEMRKKQQAEKKVPKYDRTCFHDQDAVKQKVKEGMKHVVRLFMPETEIAFDDAMRGHIVMHGSNLDDQVLMKSDGFPTYHLGVVVDDHLMKITHVLRGEEWLPSTPKHIVLYDAFGWEKPVFGHVSVLRNPDKSKLSKRKNPVWASDYLKKGILPEALLNYLSLMGWSHPDGKEKFTLEEYISVFDIKDVQTTAPVFDPVKLEWMNGTYIRDMKDDDLLKKILEHIGEGYDVKLVSQSIPLVKERMKKFTDYLPLCEFLFKRPQSYELSLEKYADILKKVKAALVDISDFTAQTIGDRMAAVAKESGMKNSEFFQMLRVTITGKKISPPLNESMAILGKDECVARL
jgi:glutamyl-tRNA synthetase